MTMIKVKSLKATLFAQFLTIIAPVALVLIYQSLSDLERTAAVERAVGLHNLAQTAASGFETFVNVATDAVDTGSLGIRAYAALRDSVNAISALSAQDSGAAAAARAVAAVDVQVTPGLAVDKLLALRP